MELNDIRAKIDAIDDELVSLFARRMDLALEVAKYKRQNGTPVLNKSREREIISRVTEQVPESLQGYTKVLFSTLCDLSRSYQNGLLTEMSPLATQIDQALKNTNEQFPPKAIVACQVLRVHTPRLPAISCFRCRALCIFTSLTAYLEQWTRVSADTDPTN